MEMKLNEMLDRLSILLIKVEKIGEPAYKEFVDYASEILLKTDTDFNVLIPALRRLNSINRQLWDVEWELAHTTGGNDKKMAEGARKVRKINNERVNYRNEISELLGGYTDQKKGYYKFKERRRD